MFIFERGVNSGFPAANHRLETPLSIALFSALFLFASATAGGITIQQGPGKTNTTAENPAAVTRANPQKRPPSRVKAIGNLGVPFISVPANTTPMTDDA